MNIPNKFQILINIRLGILLITLFPLLTMAIDYHILKDSYGQMGHGHNLPPSIIGDRQIFLNFDNPKLDGTTEKNIINLALIDNRTGNNIPHVTFIVSIYDREDKNKFTASLHGHNGEIRLEFLNKGSEEYTIHAN